jgi:type II secretory pathway pseudopilin PulG
LRFRHQSLQSLDDPTLSAAAVGRQPATLAGGQPAGITIRPMTYIPLMALTVIIGITLSIVSQQWTITVRRDQERELLFRGTRIQSAIEAYAADYEVRKSERSHRYPKTLDQLVQAPKHYLPRVYKDPVTGMDFDLIVVKGEIRGVRSTSAETPMDQVTFKEAATYQDFAFLAKDRQPGTSGLNEPGSLNPLNPLLNKP